MRTTLKRGIGRGAAFNGNGRAVLPPGVLTTMRRYSQPPPPRRTALGWTGFVLGWLLVAVATVAAGMLGGAYLYASDFVEETSKRTSRDVKIAAQRLDLAVPGEPATAIVVGYDYRPFGPEKDLPARSDTIMLLRADPATDSISMLSFPRDLIVDIRCPGKLTVRERINYAYELCGSRGTLETVKALTGLRINYLITVNFLGFRRIVKELGGVWVDVDRRYLNTNEGPGPTYAPINLKPGYQRLTGRQALRYVRFRHTDSDLYRLARQQQFVRAIKQQVASNFSVFSIPRLVNAVRDNVEVAQSGGGALDFGTLKNYAFFAYRLPPGHFFQAKVENLTGYNELYAPPESIADAVNTFSHPDVQAPEKATAVALGRKLRSAPVRPAEISLVVLNGTTTPGLAANTSYALGQRGYRTIVPPNDAPANAPSADYFQSKAYYDPAQPRARAAARQVQRLIGGGQVAPIPAEVRQLANGAMVVAVLGASFRGQLSSEPVDQTPKPQRPNVVRNPDVGRALARQVRRKVPFDVMYPTVLERSSVVDSEFPARAYTLAKDHRAVRFVFRTGAIEYWGIQMTDWDDAPVLKEANEHRRIKGREYDLYFNGPHLHMVVLRDNGVSFWVVNTILETLSNETMLAIAKGLRPLRS